MRASLPHRRQQTRPTTLRCCEADATLRREGSKASNRSRRRFLKWVAQGNAGDSQQNRPSWQQSLVSAMIRAALQFHWNSVLLRKE